MQDKSRKLLQTGIIGQDGAVAKGRAHKTGNCGAEGGNRQFRLEMVIEEGKKKGKSARQVREMVEALGDW